MTRKYTRPSFKKVVVPILHTCECDAALAAAKCIAGKGEVLLLGLVSAREGEPLSASANQPYLVRRQMRQYAKQKGVRSLGKVHVSPQIVEELFNCVQEENPDLLLLEWPCHFEAMHTTLTDIMQRTTSDIAVVRGPVTSRLKKLLVPVRGGPYAELALRISLSIANATDASVSSLHIIPLSPTKADEAPFRGLAHVLPHIPEIEPVEIQTSSPIQAILSELSQYDLVILGASARPDARMDHIGPVADRVLRESPCAVIVVKTSHALPEDTSSELMGQTAISVLVDKWFAENTYHAKEFSNLEELIELKTAQELKISLALPALNEQETVGNVIRTVKSALMDDAPLLDEIVLMDSNSTDLTRHIANDLQVPVHIHQNTLPDYGARHGKGEALWKSLFVTSGDIIVWIDTDIVNIHPRFIYGLLGPLLVNPNLQFIKGFYRRPIKVGDRIQAGGGGRVTELTARPLLNLFYPQLSGLIQPLSGEYGGRRAALECVPFSSGYGVEIGLLIDIFERFGLNAIAQVDLSERIHHNQPLESLSKMSFAIIQTVIRKLERRYGRDMIDDVNKTMKLIRYEPGRFFLDIEEIAEQERPPIIELPEYVRARKQQN